jgi:carbon storage regulator CsrA
MYLVEFLRLGDRGAVRLARVRRPVDAAEPELLPAQDEADGMSRNHGGVMDKTTLVLTRRAGERIMIAGGEITIEVVCLGEKSVRLAIRAPEDIEIDREEIHLAKQADAENVA